MTPFEKEQRKRRRQVMDFSLPSQQREEIEGPIIENLSTLGRRLSLVDPVDGSSWEVSEEDEWGWDLELIKIAAELARVMFLKNPLIHRAIRLQSIFVFGQKFQIRWPEGKEDDEIQLVIDEFMGQAMMSNYEHLFGMETEMRTTGNLFFLCSVDATAPVTKYMVQMVPLNEIIDQISDKKGILRYVKRKWRREVVDFDAGERGVEKIEAWYPVGFDFSSEQMQTHFGSDEINTDSFILHVKAGSFLHWRWGLSEVFAAMDWARAYSRFLEDLARVMHSLSEFAWQAETKDTIDNFKDSVRSGLADKRALRDEAITRRESLESGDEQEENIFVTQPGADLQPLATRHANIDPSDGRRILLQAVAALDLSEIYMGDADVGNHATAKIIERPIEMAYKARQQLWQGVFQEMLRWVLSETGSTARPEVVFPDVTEHDIKSRLEAIIMALDSGGIHKEQAARMMMGELDVKDIEFELEILRGEIAREERSGIARSPADVLKKAAASSPQGDEKPDPAQAQAEVRDEERRQERMKSRNNG